MRTRLVTFLVAVLTVGSLQPLSAAPFSPVERQRERDFWWNSYMPKPVRKERSADEVRYNPNYSDALAARLGVVDGKARIFRLELDRSVSSGRAIEGALDGNGVKVRLKW